jgi:DNA-binding GntR family transcriptional regulator
MHACILGGLIVPPEVSLFPLFKIMLTLGVLNTYFAMILPDIAYGLPFTVLLLRAYMMGIPDEMAEAARIDGAGMLRCFWSVYLPLCRPALAATALVQGMRVWNEFVFALTFVGRDSLRPLTVGLTTFGDSLQTDWPVLLAGLGARGIPRHAAAVHGRADHGSTEIDATMTGRTAPRIPAYRRAQEALLAMVRDQRLPPGAKVPSERELAARFGLSRMTVRLGVQNLVRAGVLMRDGTAGTRVADVSVIRLMDARRAFSMSAIVRGSGAQPGGRLLMFAPGVADRNTAGKLEIQPGAGIVTIRRLRTADGIPFCIEAATLPLARVPGLVAQDLAQNTSLYELLKDRYGIEPAERESEISVGPIGAADAELLGLEPGLNVLLYRSVVRDAAGIPVELVHSVNHPQRVVFSTHAPQIRV